MKKSILCITPIHHLMGVYKELSKYGSITYEPVISKKNLINILRQSFPDQLADADDEKIRDILLSDALDQEPINEIAPAVAAAAGAALPYVGKLAKGLWSGIKKLIGGGAKVATKAGAGLAKRALNQDVNIDGISTTDPLTVKLAPGSSTEELLASTNDMLTSMSKTLQQTQAMLNKQLTDLDTSVDTVAATALGTSPESVDAAQDAGISPSAMGGKKGKKSEPSKASKTPRRDDQKK